MLQIQLIKSSTTVLTSESNKQHTNSNSSVYSVNLNCTEAIEIATGRIK
jgi:hypothetical protein